MRARAACICVCMRVLCVCVRVWTLCQRIERMDSPGIATLSIVKDVGILIKKKTARETSRRATFCRLLRRFSRGQTVDCSNGCRGKSTCTRGISVEVCAYEFFKKEKQLFFNARFSSRIRPRNVRWLDPPLVTVPGIRRPALAKAANVQSSCKRGGRRWETAVSHTHTHTLIYTYNLHPDFATKVVRDDVFPWKCPVVNRCRRRRVPSEPFI